MCHVTRKRSPRLELCELEIEGLDLTLSGFSSQELDIVLLDETDESAAGEEESIPEPPADPVSQLGDLWLLGKHRLLCDDSLEKSSYEKLLEGAQATAVLTDPPYNVKIEGNVSGLGKKKHGEFTMASGEMSRGEFHEFLCTVHKHCSDHLIDGGVIYSFMDWRSIDVLMAAGREAGLELINMPVWYKGSGGMGAFLRSAHELVCQFCKGPVPKINNVELGKHGRDRTNVWVYPGANKPGSSAAGALHSQTVMIERGILVFDAGVPQIKSVPLPTAGQASLKPHSISEELYFEALAKKNPAFPALVRGFLEQLEQLGVEPELKAALNLKADVPERAKPVNIGYIRKDGRVRTSPVEFTEGAELAMRYNQALAKLIGGQVATHDGIYLSTNGKAMPLVSDLLPHHADGWLQAVADLLKKVRAKAQDSVE